jgi:hypothetical protein|tara:strand:- start:499 stop:1074 length:576 start_codon:yes stop_codon:yes gene_type:complete
MALWGTTVTTDESKPKWLTAAQKKEVYATSRGWVQLNGKGNEEVLCAIGELDGGTSGTAGLGAATITATDFVTETFDVSAGGNIDVRVIYNEKVTVTGNPTVAITNDQAGGGSAASLTAAYVSGSGTNRLTFRITIGAAGTTVVADDVLSIGAQNVALAGGTLKDTGTTLNSLVAISAAAGAAAGTLTAVA